MKRMPLVQHYLYLYKSDSKHTHESVDNLC